MPAKDGLLSDAEFAQIFSKLNEFWGPQGGRPPCRSCGSQKYFVHPALIGNRSDTVSSLSPHTRMPTVMVYCQNCGLADHYVAERLGIAVLQPKEDS